MRLVRRLRGFAGAEVCWSRWRNAGSRRKGCVGGSCGFGVRQLKLSNAPQEPNSRNPPIIESHVRTSYPPLARRIIIRIIIPPPLRLPQNDQVLLKIVLLLDQIALGVNEAAPPAVGTPACFPERLKLKKGLVQCIKRGENARGGERIPCRVRFCI